MSNSEHSSLRGTRKTCTFLNAELHLQLCNRIEMWLNPPHSDSTPRDSLCPWIQLEWFHQNPGTTRTQTNETEVKPLRVYSVDKHR